MSFELANIFALTLVNYNLRILLIKNFLFFITFLWTNLTWFCNYERIVVAFYTRIFGINIIFEYSCWLLVTNIRLKERTRFISIIRISYTCCFHLKYNNNIDIISSKFILINKMSMLTPEWIKSIIYVMLAILWRIILN